MCSGQPSNSDTITRSSMARSTMLRAPRPVRRIALLMPDDDFAADHRMPAEPARQDHHAHAVIDAELQRLHALALRLAFRRRLPAFGVLIGEAAHLRQRVIDVAGQIVLRQLLIAAARRGNADFLGSPVEIKPDLVGRKLHERAHRGVGVEQALGLGIAPGRGAERKQARAIAAIGADRDPGADDDAETVAQRMQPLDRRVGAVHHPEGVAVELQRAGIQPRPIR